MRVDAVRIDLDPARRGVPERAQGRYEVAPPGDTAERTGPAAPARDPVRDLRVETNAGHEAEEPHAGAPEVDPPRPPRRDRGRQGVGVGAEAERPGEQILVPSGQDGERQAGRHLVDDVRDRAVAADGHRAPPGGDQSGVRERAPALRPVPEEPGLEPAAREGPGQRLGERPVGPRPAVRGRGDRHPVPAAWPDRRHGGAARDPGPPGGLTGRGGRTTIPLAPLSFSTDPTGSNETASREVRR